jgi:hypothetical protein
VNTNVLQEHTASIFKAEMKRVRASNKDQARTEVSKLWDVPLPPFV